MEKGQKQLPQKHVQLHSNVMYICEYVVFSGCHATLPQRKSCSHPINIPFTKLTNHRFRSIFKKVFAPNSPFETCPIRECFLVRASRSGRCQHADFRPLFREPKNTTTLERALYVAEDSSKFKLLWGSVALHPKKRLRRRLVNTLLRM